MNSGFSDPNNHVPEVSPDDAWGDSEEHVAGPAQATAVLPPRRAATEKKQAATSPPENGLRIDSRTFREDSGEEPRRLKVQEISGSVIRLEQEDSAPPRVERIVTFQERPARLESGKNPRGEGKEWGRVHGGSTRWLFATGTGVAALVVLVMALLPKINAPNAARETPRSEFVVAQEEEHQKVAEQLNRLLQRQSAAMQIYRSFTQAAHSDDILPMIREGAGMKDALAKSWRPMNLPPQWAPASDSGWLVVELAGHPCGLLEGFLPDQSKFSAYFTCEGDKLLLDWKATTAYGTASFKELESGSGDAGEIRGTVSLADFYTAAFPESDYQSFRFTSPDEQHVVWCYAPRNSAECGQIEQEFQPGAIIADPQGPKKMTLRLMRGPQDSLPNQWLIGDLLHLNWMAP